ncbi:unnamed protein product [Thelazia callipaeda]|uniref:Uncharacterized protein n=1 Tax=Thelazia callipaeda TaxID=103827 RepID=A0A0N5D6E3_THECL|nr:unnamed protein product [Thelazia callipaeda]
MDSFASVHSIHEFLNFQHRRRNTHSAQNRVHRNPRSVSLCDRRGLITAPSISYRKRHETDSMDTLAMLVHLMENENESDPIRMLFPATIDGTSQAITNKRRVWQQIHTKIALPIQSFSQVRFYKNK